MSEYKFRAQALFTKLVQLTMGNGGQFGTLMGTLFRMAATTSSATGAATTVGLALPANTLITTGHAVRLRVYGRCAANANAKTVQAVFGGTTISILNAVASNAKDFYFDVVVRRTGKNAQQISIAGYANGALLDNLSQTATETETGSLNLQVNVPATTGAADVVLNEVVIMGESG